MDIVNRAKIMRGMLTMGEMIEFGQDAKILQELIDEVERLRVINKKLLDSVYNFQHDVFNVLYDLEKSMDEIEESIAEIKKETT